MRTTRSLLFVAATLSSAGLLCAQDDSFAAWTHRATVQAAAPGLTRVELSREALDASRAVADTVPLRDVRLVSASGVETPFLMEWPKIVAGRTLAATNFTTQLQGNHTVVVLSVPGDAVVSELRLQTGNSDFIKAATLEGTLDLANWRVITDREIIFRQGGAERLRFPLEPGPWKAFRVTIDDQRSGPVGFTGATLLAREEDETPTTVEDLPIVSRSKDKGETRLRLDLGSRHRYLHSLRVICSDPLFQRTVNLGVVREDGSLADLRKQHTLYRVALEERRSEELEFVIRQSIQQRQVELRIANGDSPPLRVEKIEAKFYRMALVFHAEAPGTWHLLTGNANAFGPRYDVASLLGDLKKVNAASAEVSVLGPNPNFRKEATVPEAGEGGAALDVTAWAFHKPINFTEPGVIRVELDAETLAQAALDLRDLRVVQDGRQLPYFIERGVPSKEMEVKFQQEPDPKRASLSRWRLDLPMAAYPVTRLQVTSPTSVFERHLHVWENGRDSFGNAYRRPLGDVAWRRTSAQPDAAHNVPVLSRPTGSAIYLETDNGDNAPLQLGSVRVVFNPANVVFKTVTAAPVHLVYGNPRASTPRYDIHLVRAQLEKVGEVNATLGSGVRGDGHEAPSTDSSGVGSVWLWVVLALVVVGLLWIVAKLLPAPPAST